MKRTTCTAIAITNLPSWHTDNYVEKRRGGYTVSGGLRPASISVENGYLPLGLAHNVTLKNAASEDQAVRWQDVDIDTTTVAYKLRREIESSGCAWKQHSQIMIQS